MANLYCMLHTERKPEKKRIEIAVVLATTTSAIKLHTAFTVFKRTLEMELIVQYNYDSCIFLPRFCDKTTRQGNYHKPLQLNHQKILLSIPCINKSEYQYISVCTVYICVYSIIYLSIYITDVYISQSCVYSINMYCIYHRPVYTAQTCVYSRNLAQIFISGTR